MDNQECFKSSSAVELNTYCPFMASTMDIYIFSPSMDHRISSLLILDSCKSAYNMLPSFD
jgi:hypothetical protein